MQIKDQYVPYHKSIKLALTQKNNQRKHPKKIVQRFDYYKHFSKKMISKSALNEYQYLNHQQKSLQFTLQKSKILGQKRQKSLKLNNKSLLTLQNSKIKIKEQGEKDKNIDSINNYAQNLKMALINQYKYNKKRSTSLKTVRIVNAQPQKDLQAQINEQNCKLTNNYMSTKYSNKMAYKTLNLLYQAIIDNSFQKRKKQEFELQASKLPMVDRFNLKKNKKQYFDQRIQQIYMRPRQTKQYFNESHIKHRDYYKPKQNKEIKLKIIDEQSDIIPWNTNQLYLN